MLTQGPTPDPKFECSPESTKNFDFFLPGGFVISDIVFGYDNLICNLSPSNS